MSDPAPGSKRAPDPAPSVASDSARAPGNEPSPQSGAELATTPALAPERTPASAPGSAPGASPELASKSDFTPEPARDLRIVAATGRGPAGRGSPASGSTRDAAGI